MSDFWFLVRLPDTGGRLSVSDCQIRKRNAEWMSVWDKKCRIVRLLAGFRIKSYQNFHLIQHSNSAGGDWRGEWGTGGSAGFLFVDHDLEIQINSIFGQARVDNFTDHKIQNEMFIVDFSQLEISLVRIFSAFQNFYRRSWEALKNWCDGVGLTWYSGAASVTENAQFEGKIWNLNSPEWGDLDPCCLTFATIL